MLLAKKPTLKSPQKKLGIEHFKKGRQVLLQIKNFDTVKMMHQEKEPKGTSQRGTD